VSLGGRCGSAFSKAEKSPLVFDLGINECSPLFFGRDEEMNGETVCLGWRLLLIGIALEDSELLPSIWEDDSERRWWIELLLRILFDCSILDSERFREKNEALDAVIGVLGVLVVTRRGGGVTWPSERVGSCRAAILLVVGVLNGSKFNGGSRSGCRFFFLTGVALFC